MRKAQHLDITTRLEATKRHGLVDDYIVEWPGAFASPHVIVKGRTSVPAQVTKNYLSALLASYVPSEHIRIT